MTRRKLKLSPAQRDVLVLLEEAGEEEMNGLVTEMMFGGNRISGGHTVDDIDVAVRGLYRLGLVYLAEEVRDYYSSKYVVADIDMNTFRIEEYMELDSLKHQCKWLDSVKRPLFLILESDGAESYIM